MSQIHDELCTTGPGPAPPPKRRSPLRRPAVILPVAACALAGAVVAGVALRGAWGGDEGVPTGPLLTTDAATASTQGPRLLARIAQRSRDVPLPPVRQDQYVYVRSVQAETYVKQGVFGDEAVSEKLHPRQGWNFPDGKRGWLIEPGETGEEGMALGGSTPLTDAHNHLLKLRTDPDALLKEIYEDADGRGNGRHRQAFEAIGDLLQESHRRLGWRPRSTRPRPRSPVWPPWRTPSTPRTATDSRAPSWTRPADSAPNGSSTSRSSPSSGTGPSRWRAAPIRAG